uniref:Uncharacterized protein n=1 Tax=Cacopsylla melanoneura TaxID=428564 RepID=A0A8D8U0A1_9HEMI
MASTWTQPGPQNHEFRLQELFKEIIIIITKFQVPTQNSQDDIRCHVELQLSLKCLLCLHDEHLISMSCTYRIKAGNLTPCFMRFQKNIIIQGVPFLCTYTLKYLGNH